MFAPEETLEYVYSNKSGKSVINRNVNRSATAQHIENVLYISTIEDETSSSETLNKEQKGIEWKCY